MLLPDIVKKLNDKLNLSSFAGDVSNNGLQVEGKEEVKKIIFAVDASLELFEIAKERKADFIFVHHGISWGSEPRRITGSIAKRLKVLLENNISLYAAHLPLDAHETLGNNANLAKFAGLAELTPWLKCDGSYIGFSGVLENPLTVNQIADKISFAIKANGNIFGNKELVPKKVAICSGGGGSLALSEALAVGADLLITGEMTHTMYHFAKENDISVISFGHYQSETVGPKAVMEYVENEFNIQCEFVDLPTGM